MKHDCYTAIATARITFVMCDSASSSTTAGLSMHWQLNQTPRHCTFLTAAAIRLSLPSNFEVAAVLGGTVALAAAIGAKMSLRVRIFVVVLKDVLDCGR